MQLKRIEIVGFKSFADKTTIQVEPGITAIVGPNGSGKSNIADAIRWVLGEQSAKSLRGASMSDVIFAGTEKRKMLGYAEVVLVVDNSDHTLAIEYDEVTIARRIYRSGESEYYINKSECRLKDVQELFMDTGVGKDGYSIISQGRIETLVTGKAEDRRNIFEEASGIVKYRTRREESIRKLENTKQNLDRVNDILIEVTNNLAPTEEKAQVAKKYLALRDELKQLEIISFVSLIDNTDSVIEGMNSKMAGLEESLKNQQEIVDGLSIKKENTRVLLEELLNETNNSREALYTNMNEKDRLESKIASFDSRVIDMKNTVERLKNEIVEHNIAINLSQEELLNRKEKLELLEKNKEKYSVELEQKEALLKLQMANMNEKDLQIENLKSINEEKKEGITQAKINLATCTTNIQALNMRIKEIQEAKEEQKDVTDVQNELANSQQLCEQLEEKINTLKKESTKKSEEKLSLENEITKCVEKEQSLKQLIIEASSKLNYMQNLESETAGYSSSVKAIMDVSKRNKTYGENIYGTLAMLVSTEEKYEKAVEIALGGYIQNIVVDNDKTAKELVSFLKEGMLGRATFLPLASIRTYREEENIQAKKMPGYIGMASQLVKYMPKYESAVSMALGRTIIVDSLENGIKMSKIVKGQAKIVTLDGEVIAQNGSITGGKTAAKSLTLVGRNRKLEEYKSRLDKATQEMQLIVEQKKLLLGKYEQVQNELKEKINIYNEKNNELARLSEKKDALEAKYKNEIKTAVSSEEKLKKLQQEIAELKEKCESENEYIKESTTILNDNMVEIEEYVRFNKEKATAINILNEDIMNLKISVSSFDDSKTSIDELLTKMKNDIEMSTLSIERKETAIKDYLTSIENSQSENELDKKKLEQLIAKADEQKQTVEQLKQQQSDNLANQTLLDNEADEARKLLEKLTVEKAKMDEKKIKYDDDKVTVQNKMWEEYELTISNAKEFMKAIPEEIKALSKTKVEQQTNRLKMQIKQLGDVSVSAIEEYATLKERHTFIQAQKTDLEQAMIKLENLIDNTTSIMKTQFATEFKKISQNFKQVFSELFGGGRAELIITDEKNLLECGIEIEAQPPGKKLQNLSLLSGGEKALTAIAILFAILKLKSPPFCVLDEIEAALDDVNVIRFAEYIKKYSKEAQFLVITHRKGTMEIASSVYGVTMQEHGISTIISMKLK